MKERRFDHRRAARVPRDCGCVVRGSGGGEAEQEGGVAVQGCLDLSGPVQRRRLVDRAQPGPPLRRKQLGSKIQTTYKDKAFSNAQVPQIVAGLVRDGYKMIFATSLGELEYGVNGQLYAKYPKVLFEQATGQLITKNQSEYFGAGEDTIYLSGMAAGAASKKGVIGYVVPFGVPEVVRHINAFTLGAQATHPGAKVKIVWTNAWYSPPKETAAAKALVAGGGRRPRPERRQPCRRGLRGVQGESRGSATTPTRRSLRRSNG